MSIHKSKALSNEMISAFITSLRNIFGSTTRTMNSSISFHQIQELKSQIQDRAAVLSPGSEGYGSSLERWSAVDLQKAGVIIRPKDVESIAVTVRFAKDHSLDLAVKGGGHATDTSTSTNGGILIDLNSMKHVDVNVPTKVVTAQGGALWADVNQAASQHQLAVVGGTFSHVGVGGFTLRGGYGYLTPQHGIGLDNILSATVVTADGQVLQASREENPDLFWAVRGAGANVGAVAELTLRAHAQPNYVWNGMRAYAKEKLPEVIQALNMAMVHPEGKAAAQCVFSLSPETKEPTVITVLFFNGTEEEGQKHYSNLLELECLSSDMRMKPYAEANTLLDPVAPPGGRKKLIGLQLAPPIRPEFAMEVIQETGRQLSTELDMASSSIELEFLDLSRLRQVPVRDAAFAARNQEMNGAIILQWTDPAKDRDFLAWGEKMQAKFEDELRLAGHQPDKLVSSFLNYTRENKATPTEMFGANGSKLVEIKQKYDPGNVFNKLNPLY